MCWLIQVGIGNYAPHPPLVIPVERPHAGLLIKLLGVRDFESEYEELWMGEGMESSFGLETLFNEGN